MFVALAFSFVRQAFALLNYREVFIELAAFEMSEVWKMSAAYRHLWGLILWYLICFHF